MSRLTRKLTWVSRMEPPRADGCKPWYNDQRGSVRLRAGCPHAISSLSAAWMPPTYFKLAKGPGKQSPAKPVQDRQAMKQMITTDLVEAYSLCPRKAFLLMAGEPNPGPHEYVRMTDVQVAASRQARRAILEEAGELPPGGGAADLSTGPKVVADAEPGDRRPPRTLRLPDEGERTVAVGKVRLRAGEGDRHVPGLAAGRPWAGLPGVRPR